MEVELRIAATVMLVRDGQQGLETFMLRRNPQSDFVPGQFVFPGGAVDVRDRVTDEIETISVGLNDQQASSRLQVESGGLAYWVAAIRECFEEAGALLARIDNNELSLADPQLRQRFQRHREAVYAGDLTMVDLCRAEGLQLNFDDLRYVSHWITPIGPSRRFDTRFFVARSPHDQRPAHDGGETVESCWITPTEAMQLHEAGKFEMIMPTVANLEPLLEMKSVDEVMRWADSLTEIPEILPAISVSSDGLPSVFLPGEPGYEEALAHPPPHGSTP
ncbi:MAG: NUDIX hydrolase [Actinomycetota bacterium]|nr:NUDIX hydrolase [Actinomycetota bacterium]MEC9059540.1 NUDIX hydrolase [Actinomycetota bacterium]